MAILLLLAAGCDKPQPTVGARPSSRATLSPEAAFLSTEAIEVRDQIVAFVREAHPELGPELEAIQWEALPEPRVHALAVYGFTSAQWRMDMTVLPANLVAIDGVTLTEDTFDVELKYRSPPPYVLWSGKYASTPGVSEEGYINKVTRAEPIPPEEARDLAFAFVKEEHFECKPPRKKWGKPQTDKGSTRSRYLYQAGDWEALVTWNEYTETYDVDAYYERSGFLIYMCIEWTVRLSADGQNARELYYVYQAH